MVYTLVAFSCLVSCLISGPLATRFNKKRLSVVFYLVAAGGGLVGYLFPTSLVMLYLSSLLIGLGIGVPLTLVTVLLAENFDGLERISAVGLQTLFLNGGGMLCSLLAGALLTISWPSVYLVYLVLIPAAAAGFFLLPEGPLDKRDPKGEVKLMNAYMWSMDIKTFILSMSFATFFANISYSMVETGVGNPAFAGVLTSLYMVGAVVIGLLITAYVKICKSLSMWVGFVIFTFSMWLLWLADGQVLFVIASFVFGVGFGAFICVAIGDIPEHIPPTTITKNFAIWTAILSVAMFINPYVITSGAAALFTDDAASRYLLTAIILTLTCVITFFTDGIVARQETAR